MFQMMPKYRRVSLLPSVLCALFWCALSGVAARAQDVLLAPEDVLTVTVLQHPELSIERITIPSSGKINLPMAGQVVAGGKTPAQVERAIVKALSVNLIQPEVTVSLREQRIKQIFVLGTGVAKPGVYPIKPGWRVYEAIAAAGGVPGRDDETSTILSRRGTPPKTFKIDIVEVFNNPASKRDVFLRDGDVLTITALEPKRITVSGDVVKPDIYELRRAPRLLDALNAAGGPRQSLLSTRAFLLRRAQRTPLDLRAAEQVKTGAANVPLLPGDQILVEAIPALKVAVDGFVRNPGNYDLPADATFIEAVAQAGGLTVSSDQIVATVRRGREIMPLDYSNAVSDPKADIGLQTGDVVLLSEPKVLRVQVTGQVVKPGALRLPLDNATVLDAVARAGGLAIKTDSARVSVLRRGANGKQFSLQINPVALFDGRDLTQNVKLQDDDLISVSEVRATQIAISGEVLRPGFYEIREGDGIAELIARAGGPTENAALTRVTLQRGNSIRTVDVYSFLKEGGAKPDIALQQGDFVVVPRNIAVVKVIQAVVKPGDYAIPERGALTVTDALSLAGGPRDRAAAREVTVLRQGADGTRSRIISLDKISKGDLKENITLRPGDIVVVPPGKAQKNPLANFSALLGALGTAKYVGGF